MNTPTLYHYYILFFKKNIQAKFTKMMIAVVAYCIIYSGIIPLYHAAFFRQ